MITNKIFSIEKIYFDYSILKNWIPQNQKKRLHKHFEGLAALSTHSVGRRVAVKAGCKPVHFSLDGYPLSCYFSGSVATTSGHFVHKSERGTRDGGFHIPAAVLWKQPDFLLIPIRKNSPCFPAEANGAHEASHPVFPVSHASRYNTLHFASKVVCQRESPFGNPGQQNRLNISHFPGAWYSAFICCQQPPFRGLRVVPCKLT